MPIDDSIQTVIEAIIRDYNLPEDSIYQHANLSNNGTNKGKEISKSICISEPDYPTVPGRKITQSKSSVIMNMQVINEDKFELLIRNNQFEVLDLPPDAIIKDVKSDVSFIHIVFDEISNGMLRYLEDNIRYCIDNYSSSSSFGCCSKYEQCSKVGKCLHINKLYSKGCSYRKNLNQGKVFY